MPTSSLERRQWLIGAAATLATPQLAHLAAAASPLIVTPGQTEGPFYPVKLPADMDADLVRVKGQAAQAVGQVTHISGRILDRQGQIVRGAMVEIWQCDAQGIYSHPGDSGHARHDAAFQGYGRAQVDAAGRYAFRTLRPAPTPAARRISTSRCMHRGKAASPPRCTSPASASTPATALSTASATARPATRSSSPLPKPTTSSRARSGHVRHRAGRLIAIGAGLSPTSRMRYTA